MTKQGFPAEFGVSMRTSSTKNTLIIGISIVLGASLLSVGISNAAGTSIKACAKKSNGAMRLIDTNKNCKKSERTLTWGTQGDAGTAGAAGATGAAGSNGSNGGNGVSTAYAISGTSTGGNVTNTSRERVVLTLSNVPAGNYIVSFSSQLDKFTSDGAGAEIASTNHSYIDCTLTSAASWSARNATNQIFPIDSPSSATFSFLRTVFLQKVDTNAGHTNHMAATGEITLSTTTSINLLCKYTDDGVTGTDGVALRFPSITLVKVNEILP